ncbi:MAG: hypothetical protein J5940_04710 [Clostridia bacterium]|nr:hypothetical protein [Clostridia bacterium]
MQIRKRRTIAYVALILVLAFACTVFAGCTREPGIYGVFGKLDVDYVLEVYGIKISVALYRYYFLTAVNSYKLASEDYDKNDTSKWDSYAWSGYGDPWAMSSARERSETVKKYVLEENLKLFCAVEKLCEEYGITDESVAETAEARTIYAARSYIQNYCSDYTKANAAQLAAGMADFSDFLATKYIDIDTFKYAMVTHYLKLDKLVMAMYGDRLMDFVNNRCYGFSQILIPYTVDDMEGQSAALERAEEIVARIDKEGFPQVWLDLVSKDDENIKVGYGYMTSDGYSILDEAMMSTDSGKELTSVVKSLAIDEHSGIFDSAETAGGYRIVYRNPITESFVSENAYKFFTANNEYNLQNASGEDQLDTVSDIYEDYTQKIQLIANLYPILYTEVYVKRVAINTVY